MIITFVKKRSAFNKLNSVISKDVFNISDLISQLNWKLEVEKLSTENEYNFKILGTYTIFDYKTDKYFCDISGGYEYILSNIGINNLDLDALERCVNETHVEEILRGTIGAKFNYPFLDSQVVRSNLHQIQQSFPLP